MVSDAEYLKMAEESYRESINIAKSDGWNVEKEDKANNVVVEIVSVHILIKWPRLRRRLLS